MGFKKKQMLGFGLILLFLAILLSFMMFTLNNLKSSMTEIVENRYEKVQASMEIRQLFSRSDREILFAANDANKEERAESLEIINENHNLIESKIAGLSGSLNQAKAKQLLKEFETQYASYSITEAEIIQKIKSENSSDNLSSLMDDQREKRTKVISTMDEFKDYQEGVMKDTLSNSKQTYEDMIGFVCITCDT